MPVYSYECDKCGGEFDRFLSLANYQVPQKCQCGAPARRVIKPVAVRADYQGYSCPITGNWIEGKKAHEENLKKHGCRVFESGEREAVLRSRAASEAAFEEKIAETAAEFVEALPSAKREQLGRELESGADITVERQ